MTWSESIVAGATMLLLWQKKILDHLMILTAIVIDTGPLFAQALTAKICLGDQLGLAQGGVIRKQVVGI